MPQILGDISPYRRKGDKVSLSCVASGGNPFPELTWVRNGLPLRDSGKSGKLNWAVIEECDDTNNRNFEYLSNYCYHYNKDVYTTKCFALGLFTSSSKALFSKGNNVLQEKNKVRKFTPQILIDKLTKEIRSVLEFPLIAEDHGAIYKCRSFAEATMSVPQDSALTITFNITCKLFHFMPKTLSEIFLIAINNSSYYRAQILQKQT